MVSDKGALPDPEIVSAIQDFPFCKNVTETECVTPAHIRCVPGLSSGLPPLLQKNMPFVLLDEQLRKLHRIKNLL